MKCGQVEILQIVEIEAGKIIQNTIKDATQHNIQKMSWLYPDFADEQGNLKAVVQSFLIKSDSNNILVDACNGNHKTRTDFPEWSNLQTNFIKNLHPMNEKDIDFVICTHFHCDHVGWNTKLKNKYWAPAFPNAKYIFVKDEYDYWSKQNNEMKDDKAAFDDSIRPVIDAGLAKLVDTSYKVDSNVSLMPTPGHTPGHASVLIESNNKSAIISGDVFHHPCQITHPEWGLESNTLPEKALETRKMLLEKIADMDTVLIGSHFSKPCQGNIIRTKEGFVFKV